MKRRLLVTVSGMVGSGKTTAAQQVMSVFRRNGVDAAYWRFQRLPCVTLRLRRSQEPPRSPSGMRARSQVYKQQPLTFTRALGYATRIIAFQVYRRLPGAPRVAVTNRYFYDNLVHYTQDSKASRLYGRVLARIIPKPALGFLLVASPATLAERRPGYSLDYIRGADAAYRRLGARVPELVILSSEPGEQTLQRVETAVQKQLLNGDA